MGPHAWRCRLEQVDAPLLVATCLHILLSSWRAFIVWFWSPLRLLSLPVGRSTIRAKHVHPLGVEHYFQFHAHYLQQLYNRSAKSEYRRIRSEAGPKHRKWSEHDRDSIRENVAGLLLVFNHTMSHGTAPGGVTRSLPSLVILLMRTTCMYIHVQRVGLRLRLVQARHGSLSCRAGLARGLDDKAQIWHSFSYTYHVGLKARRVCRTGLGSDL